MKENGPIYSNELYQIGFTNEAITQHKLNNELSLKEHGLYPLICSKTTSKKQEALIYELTYKVKIEKLKKLIEKLDNEKVEYVLLKGIVLANTVYEEAFNRPFSDIDILIHEKDSSKIKNIFKDLNYYNPSGKDYIHSYAQFTRRLNISKNLNLDIDVHLALIGNLTIRSILNTDEIIDEKKQLEIEFKKFNVISKPYLLLHSCIHYNQHKIKADFIRLIWIVDTTRIIDSMSETEIKNFIDLVNNKGLKKTVTNTLLYVERTMNNFNSKKITSLLFETSKAETSFLKPRKNFEYHLVQLLETKNIYKSLCLIREKLIRPRKFLLLKYGYFPKIYYVYYYIRSFFD